MNMPKRLPSNRILIANYGMQVISNFDANGLLHLRKAKIKLKKGANNISYIRGQIFESILNQCPNRCTPTLTVRFGECHTNRHLYEFLRFCQKNTNIDVSTLLSLSKLQKINLLVYPDKKISQSILDRVEDSVQIPNSCILANQYRFAFAEFKGSSLQATSTVVALENLYLEQEKELQESLTQDYGCKTIGEFIHKLRQGEVPIGNGQIKSDVMHPDLVILLNGDPSGAETASFVCLDFDMKESHASYYMHARDVSFNKSLYEMYHKQADLKTPLEGATFHPKPLTKYERGIQQKQYDKGMGSPAVSQNARAVTIVSPQHQNRTVNYIRLASHPYVYSQTNEAKWGLLRAARDAAKQEAIKQEAIKQEAIKQEAQQAQYKIDQHARAALPKVEASKQAEKQQSNIGSQAQAESTAIPTPTNRTAIMLPTPSYPDFLSYVIGLETAKKETKIDCQGSTSAGVALKSPIVGPRSSIHFGLPLFMRPGTERHKAGQPSTLLLQSTPTLSGPFSADIAQSRGCLAAPGHTIAAEPKTMLRIPLLLEDSPKTKAGGGINRPTACLTYSALNLNSSWSRDKDFTANPGNLKVILIPRHLTLSDLQRGQQVILVPSQDPYQQTNSTQSLGRPLMLSLFVSLLVLVGGVMACHRDKFNNDKLKKEKQDKLASYGRFRSGRTYIGPERDPSYPFYQTESGRVRVIASDLTGSHMPTEDSLGSSYPLLGVKGVKVTPPPSENYGTVGKVADVT